MRIFLVLMSLIMSTLTLAGPVVKVEFEVGIVKPQTDILFVIDNSASMGAYQSALAGVSEVLLEEIKEIDFKITAINTDIESTESAPVIDSSHVNPLDALKTMMTLFGTNGGYQEMPFQNIYSYLKKPEGIQFARPKTSLEVIILTDEQDQSVKTVNDMVELFDNKKATVNSIIPFVNSVCSQQQRSNTKIEDLTAQTNGLLIDLCGGEKSFISDYRDLAKEISKRALHISNRVVPIKFYQFLEVFNVDSLTVSFGSQIIPRGLIHTGWTYDREKNKIYFGENIELSDQPTDTKFTIRYQGNK